MPLVCYPADKDSWTLDQLLLTNALTCYRSQLLALLRQDEDAVSHIRALVAAAAAVYPADSTTAPPAAATAAAAANRAVSAGNGAPGHWQQLQSALRKESAPQRLLLVLAAGWLLRAQVMLQLAEAVETVAEQQQGFRHLTVQMPTGDICYLLMSSVDVAPIRQHADVNVLHTDAAHMKLNAAQQQEQYQLTNQQGVQQQQQQGEAAPDPQQGAAAKTPLRRGSVAAVKANADNDSSSSEGQDHSHKHHRKRSSSTHKRSSRKGKDRRSSRKHRRKRSRRHSNSDSDAVPSGSGSDSDSSSSNDGRKRRKRRWRSGRSRHSSSDAASSEEDEWAAMDLDAGGELLAAADFQLRPQSAAQRTSASKHPQQQGAGSRHASKSEAAQQQQEEGVIGAWNVAGVDAVQDRLASLAVGGRLWQWPQCVVEVSRVIEPNSVDRSVRMGAGSSSASSASSETGTQAQHVVITGSVVEVADAVAQLWLCCTLQQAMLA